MPVASPLFVGGLPILPARFVHTDFTFLFALASVAVRDAHLPRMVQQECRKVFPGCTERYRQVLRVTRSNDSLRRNPRMEREHVGTSTVSAREYQVLTTTCTAGHCPVLDNTQ